MSEISNSQQAQTALFQKLGIKTLSEKNRENSQTLGQEDFLRLMTSQLQNQDPFAPMENGDFIAQMAQFSSVTGINRMSESLDKMSGQFDKMRIAMATDILGHSVLAPGNVGTADRNGELHGVLDLPKTSIATLINLSDPSTGELLHTIDLGAQSSGLVGFSWTDLPEGYRSGDKPILISAMVNFGSGPENIQPSVFARVLGSEIKDDQLMLDVENNGSVNSENILRFRM